MGKTLEKLKYLLITISFFSLFISCKNISSACCGTTERVEVPACFLIDNEPKIKENLESAKTTIMDLTADFTDAAMVLENIEGLIMGAGDNPDSAATAITREINDAKTKYNTLREKLGARRKEGETSEGPSESSLIGKLRQVFDRYKVEKDGEFKPRLTECDQILNSFARAVNIERALLRRLKFEETRAIFGEVNKIANELVKVLNQCVENIDLSINDGVCLWKVVDDNVSDTSVEPKSDVKKKRLPVGTKVKTKAKQREVTNDLNPDLKEVNANIASPDQCKFHHVHGKVKSKEDPDQPFCGHGSVDNKDIECPNCPPLKTKSIKIPETLSESECVLFKVPDPGTTTVERDPRSNYQDWIKQLICTYVETDFTGESNIEKFAATVFAAFEKNIPTLVNPIQNIIHIVAKNPAHKPTNDAKPVLIDAPLTKESNKEEGKSAVGITRSVIGKIPLFQNMKGATTEEERRKLIPISENAIIYLFSVKKVADIFTEKSNEEIKRAKDELEKSINMATINFQQDFLSESNLMIIPIKLGAPSRSTTGAGMAGIAPTSPRDDTNTLDVMNFFVDVEFMTNNTVKPSEVPVGDPLGITIPITFVSQPKFGTFTSTEPSNLESIEPLEKFKEENSVKKRTAVQITTSVLMRVASGRPICVCFDKDRKPLMASFNCKGECNVIDAIRVISNNGQDLTGQIREHELKHVEDTFVAFKEKLIGGIKERLSDPSLDPLIVERQFSVEFIPQMDSKNPGVAITATYLLKSGVKQEDFEAKIKSLFEVNKKKKIDRIKEITAIFAEEKDKKADAFHATDAGKGITDETGMSIIVDPGTGEPFEEKPGKR